MPELPSVDGRQAISAFEKSGFKVVRIRGSHHIMKKPGKRLVLTVPVHGAKPLKPGLLRGLIRASGMSVEQFLENLS